MQDNPFHQPLPRKGVLLRARLWNATPEGKDASTGSLTAVVNKRYLWLGRSISIPLPWIREVRPTGPGFSLVWSNELTGKHEGANFCIRTFFGYNRKKRDRFMETITGIAEQASRMVAHVAARESRISPRCQVCGQTDSKQYDFRRIINVLFYWAARKDRAVLCRAHACRRLHLNLLFNSVLGVLGLPGVFATPVINVMQANEPRRDGIFSLTAVIAYLVLSCLPFVALVWGIIKIYKSIP